MMETLKGKRIALIGGAGFIGHNLALELQRLGAEPHVVDSLQVNNLGVSDQSIALPVGPHIDLDDMTYIAERFRSISEELAE